MEKLKLFSNTFIFSTNGLQTGFQDEPGTFVSISRQW